MSDWMQLAITLVTMLVGGGLVSLLTVRATQRKLVAEGARAQAQASDVSVQAAARANETLTKTLGQLEHDQERLREELSMARDDLTTTRNDLTTTRDELRKTREELAATRRELSATRDELKQLQRRATENSQLILRLTQENAALRLRFDRVSGEAQMVTEE